MYGSILSTYVIEVYPLDELWVWCKSVEINKGKMYQLEFMSMKTIEKNKIILWLYIFISQREDIKQL